MICLSQRVLQRPIRLLLILTTTIILTTSCTTTRKAYSGAERNSSEVALLNVTDGYCKLRLKKADDFEIEEEDVTVAVLPGSHYFRFMVSSRFSFGTTLDQVRWGYVNKSVYMKAGEYWQAEPSCYGNFDVTIHKLTDAR